MDAFIEFVKNSRQNYALIDNYKFAHIIIGNEACDLDSTVSSLALAYHLKSISNTKDTLFLPVLNATKEEFEIRTLNCYCLKKIGIDHNWLLYWNDIDFKNLLTKLRASLVDHHVLAVKNQLLDQYVVEIFDHRPIDKSVKWKQDVRRRIEQVGSCSTLICDEILKNCKELTNDLAKLLYDTIDFDTVGFKPEADKARPLDFRMAEELEKYLKVEKDRLSHFEELWAVHNDISHLTPKQLLLRDLKIVNSVYIPGVPMVVEQYLKMPNILTILTDFILEKGCSVLVIMGLTVKDTVERDLAVMTVSDDALMERIVENLLRTEVLSLQEKNLGLPGVKYFFQQNIKLGRKRILPIIKEVAG